MADELWPDVDIESNGKPSDAGSGVAEWWPALGELSTDDAEMKDVRDKEAALDAYNEPVRSRSFLGDDEKDNATSLREDAYIEPVRSRNFGTGGTGSD